MKKILAMLIGLMFLFSAFAVAEDADPTAEPVPTLYEDVETEEEDTSEEVETIEESSDVEEVAEEYEDLDEGDEVVEEVEEDLETDEEIEEDLEITEEEAEEIEEAEENVGLKQYAVNVQLRHRYQFALNQGQAIIDYVTEQGEDASELESILEELKTLNDGVDVTEMTDEELQDHVEKAKEIVARFKEKAHELVDEEDLPAIRNKIKAYEMKNRKKLELIKKKAMKARELHNRKLLARQMRKVAEDARQLRKDGQKLMNTAERLRDLNRVKNAYKNGDMSAEQAREQWKNQVREYRDEKQNTVVTNERAKLAIAAARITQAIRQAKAAGKEVPPELVSKLREVNKQIEDFKAGKITAREAVAKAATIRSRLSNMENNEQIKQRIQNIIQARQQIAEQRQVIKDETAGIKQDVRQIEADRVDARRAAATTDTAAGNAPATDATTAVEAGDIE
jgi:hypothetical protein